MTSRTGFANTRRRDQDQVERHINVKSDYDGDVPGMRIKVRGNNTEDERVRVVRIGGVFLHLPADAEAEVFLFTGGHDTHEKNAMVDMPRDKQRKTKEGQNGIQAWNDPDLAIFFTKDGKTRVTGKDYAVGPAGTLQVKDGHVYVRGDLHIGGVLRSTAGGAPNIPAFEAE